ncbi:MAG: hypothetical protein ACHQDE_05690, partial [Acidimicrobiia bacterium]
MIGRRAVAGLGLAAALVVGLPVGLVDRPPSAQAASGAAPTLVLAGQSPWTPLAGTFTMRLVGLNVPAGTTVALT